MLDKLVDIYGYSDAITKYEKAMRNKKFYKEKDEESIQDCLNYLREEWHKSRNKKISSLFERRIFNFNDYKLFVYSSK
jgi:hypothetical protein